MNQSPPVTVLTTLGALTVLIGFFAAGELLVAALGFGALVAAGLIQALDVDRHGSVIQPLRKI